MTPETSGAARRPVRAIVLAVSAAAVAALLAFALAPARSERSAIADRTAMAHAAQAFALHQPAAALLALQSSPEARNPSPAYLRATLRYAAAADALDAHFATTTGPFRTRLSTSDLRGALDEYTRRRRPDMELAMLRALAERQAETPAEAVRLARALAATGDLTAAAAMARRAAPGLRGGESPPDGVFVITLLASVGDAEGARRVARSWLGPKVPPATVLAITPAIVQAGHADLAVDILRPRRTDSVAVEEALAYAMRVAATTNPGIRAELTRDLLAARPHAQGAAQVTLVHDLFAYADFPAVRDTLVRDGSWREEPLRSAFVGAMQARGETPRLRDLLVAEARSAEPEVVRRAARQLAEIGYARSASVALADLAARTGPDSPAMQDLMYVWRAHGIEPDPEWFAARVTAADDSAAKRWLDRLSAAVSEDATLALLARLDDPAARPAITTLRATHLAWRDDSPELRQVLARASSARLTPADAKTVFDIACAIRDTDVIRRMMDSGGPPTSAAGRGCRAQALIEAAHAAQRRGDLSAAIDAYRDADALDHLSSQDRFDFAVVLESAGSQARGAYLAALADLPRPDGPRSRHAELLRAAILTRLGRTGDAQDVLESLLTREPRDATVRTQLAELYVDAGAYRAALALTSAQPPAQASTP